MVKQRVEEQTLRERHKANQAANELLALDDARQKRFRCDWKNQAIATPEWLGVRTFDTISIEEIVPFIDWSPFFWTWELRGLYPGILKHEKWGEQATSLFKDAQELLQVIIKERRFQPRAVVGFWAATSEDDDITLYSDSSMKTRLQTIHCLRQQKRKSDEPQYFALADFIAPEESGRPDYLGGFAVTAGGGVEQYSDAFKANHDDYNAIMVKALGDRIAEALAELMHKRAREWWGFGKGETLTHEDLVKEKYRGIRPAPGYPACPDHTEKLTLWRLLHAEKQIGVQLTESMAMTPASSVSGFYFSHPEAKYFRVSQIGKDQVTSYAERKGWTIEETEKWLRPLLP